MFDSLHDHTFQTGPLGLVESPPAISVVGLGYVGGVFSACLASLGHRLVGVDIEPRKVEAITAGRAPIHEAELDTPPAEDVAAGLVSATNNPVAAVAGTDVTFVPVGTPTGPDGGCDDSGIRAPARAIDEGLRAKGDFRTVEMRCSIPLSTTMGVTVPETEAASGLRAGEDFGVAFNPEFLRQGVAVTNFRKPPKTVIGATDDRTARVLARIYEPVDASPVVTPVETAEMAKYVDNLRHAAKVCFGNQLGRLCRPLGIDSHRAMEIFVQNTKLNLSPYYLRPGFDFGGSCLPRKSVPSRTSAGTRACPSPSSRRSCPRTGRISRGPSRCCGRQAHGGSCRRKPARHRRLPSFQRATAGCGARRHRLVSRSLQTRRLRVKV